MSLPKKSFLVRAKMIHTKRQEAFSQMRNAIVVTLAAIALYGCNERNGPPKLEALAGGLAAAWQPIAHDIELDIRPVYDGNHLRLHCVLRNLSESKMDVDQQSLPWNNADAFSLSAVAADGKVIRQKSVSGSAVIARIAAPHAPVSLGSGESVEGTIDWALMRMSDIPRDQDLLILWSYSLLQEWRSEAKYALSGIMLLVPMPQTRPPVSVTTELASSESGTSVPTEGAKEGVVGIRRG